MTKNKWLLYKKRLPHNWCQLVSETLTFKGIELTAQQISAIRIGAIKDLELQKMVWTEINLLANVHSLKIKEVADLKTA